MNIRALLASAVILLGTAGVVRGGGEDAAPAVPSFRHEVIPLLTRYGCNQGGCHGKEAGQNGFKLSLRGFAPDTDYDHLLLESRGRRVNLSAPEHSLFLLKATGAVAHRGGEIFRRDSAPYRRLVEWLRAGAPGLKAEEPGLEAIEVQGGGRTLKAGGEAPLRVSARFADGSTRDVTWLTKFISNDASVLEVSAEGVVKAVREGASAVRAHFQDKVAVAGFTVPHDRKVDPARFTGGKNGVDRHIFALLEAMRIPPSPGCTDGDFVRRAFLDAIGTLPTPAEVKAFLEEPAPERREKLVDRLLARPEFTDFWALQLGDLLQNRKERDHDVRGTKGVRAFHEWLREQVARNRPWNEMARDILLASGDTARKPEVGYWIVTVGEQREGDRSDAVVSAAQSFLGTRLLCARCHNHPSERYTQDDYYHFAAFFSRVSLDREKPEKGTTRLAVMSPDEREHRKRLQLLEKEIAKLEAREDEKSELEAKKTDALIEQKRKQLADAAKQADEAHRKSVKVSQPRTRMTMEPRPLDRSTVTVSEGEDPRRALVEWMTDPKNEYFSGNMVNRVWKHFMGVGLVEPVDDLRPSNLPTNPALWAFLREEFVSGGYDLRKLMRLILTSQAYQQSSATTPENEGDRRFHSHYYARRLPAEVLLDAISQATGVPDSFPGNPVGVRAIQLADPGLDSYFLELFGRSDRVTACACQREGEVTLPQLLHMQNGDSVVRKIAAPEGRLASLTKAGAKDVVETLFLATLSRLPREPERARVEKLLAGADREEVLRDLFWALLNSKDFVFNH